MDLAAERQQQIDVINQINQAMARMEKEFSELQVMKERAIGAIQMIDRLLGDGQQKTLGDDAQG